MRDSLAPRCAQTECLVERLGGSRPTLLGAMPMKRPAAAKAVKRPACSQSLKRPAADLETRSPSVLLESDDELL